MITDARVFQEEFVPDEVEHRNQEINQLSNALEPCLHDEPPEHAFLFGPTGAGKTCIARFTLDRLREQLLDVRYQYVNCWQDYNRFRVLYRLLEGQNQAIDVHRQGTPKDELIQRLREDVETPYIVLLDEVDQLEDRQVLYDLYTLPGITLVLVANREAELFVDMDERISSRLQSGRRIRFEKYTLEELVSILEARVRRGLAEGAVDRDQLERIADEAAGDARVGIGILRSAARHATQHGLEAITDDALEAAIPDARAEIQQQNVEKLSAHQSVLYEIITEYEPISPRELNQRYQQRVTDPRSERTVRNYLTKMTHYKLIQAEGEGKARRYRLFREP